MGRRTLKRVRRKAAGRDPLQKQLKRSASTTHPLTELQRAVGSGAIRRLIKSPFIQTKLQVTSPEDESENEADRTAQAVMRSEKGGNTSSPEPATTTGNQSQHSQQGKDVRSDRHLENELAGGGSASPLPSAVREFMEPRLGADFSGVKVHTGQEAAEMSDQLQAQAFTHGRDIYFGDGKSPNKDTLTAHELAHVIQQTGRPSSKIQRRRLAGRDEREENQQIEGARTQSGLVSRRELGEVVQRSPDDETFEEAAGTINERPEEKAWSKNSAGLTEQETPGEKFLMMNFAIRETELKKEHEEFLRNTVYFGTLTSDPMAKIVIVGHADSTGDKSFNEPLAKKRAKAVENALRQMGRHNVRIETVTGKGARDPLAGNDTVVGRAKNRRVEIKVTPFKPTKPVPELLTHLQKGIKRFVFRVENFAACPFQNTVKTIVGDGFSPIPTIQFDWDGTSTSPEAFITIDDTTVFPSALGLSGDIFLTSFRNNEICKIPGDTSTCEKVFPATADVMGRAIGNAIAHEAGHALALDHVPATDNFMWSAELHPLNGKTNKTFDEKVLLKRTLQSVPETFSGSQLVHMVHRIKKKRKTKPGVVEFE